MDHGVHAVAHVDDAAETAEAEHDETKAGREHHRPLPGQGRDPAEHAASAAQPAGNLERGGDGENGEQRRHRDKRREKHLDELGRVAVLWVHEQVMHAHRQAVDQEQNEGEASHAYIVGIPTLGWAHVGYGPTNGRNSRHPREETSRCCAALRLSR